MITLDYCEVSNLRLTAYHSRSHSHSLIPTHISASFVGVGQSHQSDHRWWRSYPAHSQVADWQEDGTGPHGSSLNTILSFRHLSSI